MSVSGSRIVTELLDVAWLPLNSVVVWRRYKDAAVTAGLKAVTAVVTDSAAESGPVVADVQDMPWPSHCTPSRELPPRLFVSHNCCQQS